ncbi:hypothetical protein LTR12_005370 [Friedmanniomyces endolithicus]|nr:hypothetical protein LTR12_005370 [Friedmanniomyces endolithicus]
MRLFVSPRGASCESRRQSSRLRAAPPNLPTESQKVFLNPYQAIEPVLDHRKPPKPAIMSAPNAGRQSPDPERAQGKQQSDTPASDVNDQGQAASKDAPAEESKETLKNLPSNPKPILEDAAKEKTSKAT